MSTIQQPAYSGSPVTNHGASGLTYPAGMTYPSPSVTTTTNYQTYPANYVSTTSYSPSPHHQTTTTNYYPVGHHQSVSANRIYIPQNTEYVPPGTLLRGGMYTIYDNTAVPTFEAPVVFSNETMRMNHDQHEPTRVIPRGGSNQISSHVRLPKRTQKKKGCCAF